MSLQRPAFDLRTEFKSALREWLAEIVDIETIEALSASPTTNRIIYANDATSDADIDSGDTFGSSDISIAKRKAKLATPKVRPLIVDGQEAYICLAHPYQIKALRARVCIGSRQIVKLKFVEIGTQFSQEEILGGMVSWFTNMKEFKRTIHGELRVILQVREHFCVVLRLVCMHMHNILRGTKNCSSTGGSPEWQPI